MADVIARQSTPAFLFLYANAPLVADSISVTASPARAMLGARVAAPSIYAQVHVAVNVPSAAAMHLQGYTPGVSIFVPESITVPRRLNRSAWQARLGSRLDPIKRKFLDNNILLSAHPTDMLRIRVDRDSRTQDILSRKIIANEILPIMLPVMKDIPLRRMTRDDKDVVTFSVGDIADSKPFEAFCPMNAQLHRDDLLFRFIKDPYSELPYVLVLQVKDELGTLSYSSLLYMKYSLTIYDEPLPEAVVNAVYSSAIKREGLSW